MLTCFTVRSCSDMVRTWHSRPRVTHSLFFLDMRWPRWRYGRVIKSAFLQRNTCLYYRILWQMFNACNNQFKFGFTACRHTHIILYRRKLLCYVRYFLCVISCMDFINPFALLLRVTGGAASWIKGKRPIFRLHHHIIMAMSKVT